MILKEGQEIRVKPDLFCKATRKGRVFGFSPLGGWCRGTGQEIKAPDRLVFVNFDRRKKAPLGVETVTFYAYAESFLVQCQG